MSTLTVGRITLDCDPETLTIQAGDGRQITLTGSFVGTSLNQLKALRDELAATLQTPEPVAVTWDGDTTINGYYQPQGGQVEVVSLTTTGSNYGMVAFEADLLYLGDDAAVRFCSLVTGDTLANDHSYTGPGVGYVAPPISHYNFNPVSDGTPAYVDRVSEDGTIRVFLGVASGDNPEWHCAPANYYKAACEITVGGYLRAGLTAPNTPTSWLLSNGLVKVAPGTDGALTVSHHDASTWRAQTWTVSYAASAVGDWHAVTILANRPERAAIRLTQTRGAQQGILTLDLAVRRGSRILEGVFYSDYDSSAILLDTDSAGTTTGTPTGTMKANSADAYGHRWMIGSELSTTLTTADGSMSKTAARLPFLISKEIDGGSGVQDGDPDEDLWDQYLEWLSERVRRVIP